MRQSDRSDVRAEVDRVAQEYRGRGYQVILSPSASDLPEFARDWQPDIVARRQDDSLLIEVKRGSSVRDNERLRAIAQRVEAQPGWRFVLESSAHEPGNSDDDERFQPITPQQASEMLAEAVRLREDGHHRASLLLAWAAFEAVMRTAAEHYELRVPRSDAWSLMRELVSNGVLEREAYQRLNDAFQVRNAVAHGREPTTAAAFDRAIESLRQTAESLVADLHRPETEDPA